MVQVLRETRREEAAREEVRLRTSDEWRRPHPTPAFGSALSLIKLSGNRSATARSDPTTAAALSYSERLALAAVGRGTSRASNNHAAARFRARRRNGEGCGKGNFYTVTVTLRISLCGRGRRLLATTFLKGISCNWDGRNTLSIEVYGRSWCCGYDGILISIIAPVDEFHLDLSWRLRLTRQFVSCLCALRGGSRNSSEASIAVPPPSRLPLGRPR